MTLNRAPSAQPGIRSRSGKAAPGDSSAPAGAAEPAADDESPSGAAVRHEDELMLADAEELTDADFPLAGGLVSRLSEGVQLPAQGIDLEQLERSLLVQALERTGWNQTRAATLLGLNRDQIRYRIEKFQLEKTSRT